MSAIDILEALPEIDLIKEEDLDVNHIIEEMVNDFETDYEEKNGEEITLYPGNYIKLLINATAGMFSQLAYVMQERYRQNFLKYSHGAALRNLGALVGYAETGEESAQATLRFTVSEKQNRDIKVPQGTLVTAGDQIYFATNEELVIPTGAEYADTVATCTETGNRGNGYLPGQINIIVNPIAYVDGVKNLTESTGGRGTFSTDELRENIYNSPDLFSVAGPEPEYIELVKRYSSNIVDARIDTTEDAVVKIYVLLQNGNAPDREKLKDILNYIIDQKKKVDTDKIEILAPEITEYSIEATYYISYDQKETEAALKEEIEGAAEEFRDHTMEKIGRAINPNMMVAYMNAAGASRIEITSPVYRAIEKNQVAHCTKIDLTYGGLEKE